MFHLNKGLLFSSVGEYSGEMPADININVQRLSYRTRLFGARWVTGIIGGVSRSLS